ncbi:MAG: hypothetical protein WCQ49_03020 [Candidatus Saccharibacteria bacterium]
MNDYLSQQLTFRSNPSNNPEAELAVLIIKPDFTSEHFLLIKNMLSDNRIKIVEQIDIALKRDQILAVYNDIFRFTPNDILFGAGWKKRKLEYMLSGSSRILLVSGSDAQQICEKIKYDIRNQFGKLSVPDKQLDDNTFEELAIKNIIHAVDKDEIEIALWLFFN